MSTEDTNKAVVTLHTGVDVDAFIEDMVSGTNHNEFMPNRRVELFNEKVDSLRNVDFVLTKDEANRLKNDPRIIDVRYGTKVENGIMLRTSVLESAKTYSRTSTQNNTHYNWGFPACTSATNIFGIGTEVEHSHAYTLVGNGVDVVIMDTGILPNHPEWIGNDGVTDRFQSLDWPSVSGLSGTYTQDPSFYSDTDGHGTHVAGITAGRLYGWAKGANIHAMAVLSNAAAFGVSAGFNMIRGWHNLKSVTSTGYKRPTVVNMSWEYYKVYSNINGGTYRGTPWTGTIANSAYGMVQTVFNRIGASAPYSYIHPVRVASVDADIADCIAAGIIMVGAAGNDAHRIGIAGGPDYDNFYNDTTLPGEPVYYHRGSTPSSADGVVCVGSVKVGTNPEGKSFFSNSGPRLNVFSPGEGIQSAIPEGATKATSTTAYPLDPAFKVTKLSGTSQASPQTAGIVSCLLEARPSYTPANVVSWISEVGTVNRLNDTGGGFTDTSSLQGASNTYMRQPFNRSEVFGIRKI